MEIIIPFKKLFKHEIQQLPNVLLKRMPKASQLYNITLFYLNGDLENAYPDPEFFVYNDNSLGLENSCIVAKLSRWGRSDKEWIILAALVSPEIQLKIIDSFCHLLNWNAENSFNALDSEWAYIKTCCNRFGSGSLWFESGTTYYMTNEEGKNLKLTFDETSLEIKSLEPRHIPTVVQNWHYASKNSSKELLNALKFTGSVGLFCKDTNELIGWCFYLRDGGIHILHTQEEHRGKGYGKLLLKAISKLVSEKGHMPFTHVAQGNKASVSTQLGIGLRFSHNFDWTIYKSPADNTATFMNHCN